MYWIGTFLDTGSGMVSQVVILAKLNCLGNMCYMYPFPFCRVSLLNIQPDLFLDGRELFSIYFHHRALKLLQPAATQCPSAVIRYEGWCPAVFVGY